MPRKSFFAEAFKSRTEAINWLKHPTIMLLFLQFVCGHHLILSSAMKIMVAIDISVVFAIMVRVKCICIIDLLLLLVRIGLIAKDVA